MMNPYEKMKTVVLLPKTSLTFVSTVGWTTCSNSNSCEAAALFRRRHTIHAASITKGSPWSARTPPLSGEMHTARRRLRKTWSWRQCSRHLPVAHLGGHIVSPDQHHRPRRKACAGPCKEVEGGTRLARTRKPRNHRPKKRQRGNRHPRQTAPYLTHFLRRTKGKPERPDKRCTKRQAGSTAANASRSLGLPPQGAQAQPLETRASLRTR